MCRNQNFVRAQVPDQIRFSSFEKMLTENCELTSKNFMICSRSEVEMVNLAKAALSKFSDEGRAADQAGGTLYGFIYFL